MVLRKAGAVLLAVLTACSSVPRAPPAAVDEEEVGPATRQYEVALFEPGAGQPPAVDVSRGDFLRAVEELSRGLKPQARALQQARSLLGADEEETEVAFAVQVEDGRVVRVAPLPDAPPPTADDKAIGHAYLELCERQYGGGDCLGLLEDGPVLDEGDKQRLALALALGEVLEETRQGLREALDPRAALVSVLCMASVYLGLLLIPDPVVSKALFGVLTLGMVAWLGVDTLAALVRGWETLVHEAGAASSFEQLRQAGRKYARVLGTHSARVLLMLATAAVGGTAGLLAKRLPLLPGYARAAAHAEAQGGARLALAAEVESAALSAEGHVAVLMRARGGGGAAGAGGSGRTFTLRIRHRGGNIQVEFNGQRWHVPAHRSPKSIPKSDPVGDQLEAAARRVDQLWNPKSHLSKEEREAIKEALARGEHRLAHLLERQARGRFVENKLRNEFPQLVWSRKGIDAVDLATGYRYELLSGTKWNLDTHGRRMSNHLFRMITF